MVDGLATALWFTTLLSSLAVRDPLSVAAIVARLLAGVVCVIAGWLVTQRRAPGDGLAVAASLATAALVSAGTFWRLLPSNLDPGLRLPAAVGYWVVALVIAVISFHDDGSRARP
jgi:drug/metabolite transporter (DMT)-like permease